MLNPNSQLNIQHNKESLLEMILQESNSKGGQQGQLLEMLLEQNGQNGKLVDLSVEILAKIYEELKNKPDNFKDIEMIKGKPGEKGEKGEKGDRGERGEKGDTVIGPQGKEGPQGKPGRQGERGEMGLRGENGTNGKDGKQGRPGKDAKLPTAKEIISIISGKLKMADLADAPEFKPSPKWLGSGYTHELSDWGQFLQGLANGSIPTASGGVETPTGALNGVNTTYTVLHTPKFITLNGGSLYEGAGYSLTGLTITIDLAPNASDTLRSHY
jgi:hypothetical protein